MKGRDLKPGMVVEVGKELWMLTSQETPAGTVPMPEAKLYCEPSGVRLEQREGRWVQTHDASYFLFRLTQNVSTNDSVRVQVPARVGCFLGESERVALMDG